MKNFLSKLSRSIRYETFGSPQKVLELNTLPISTPKPYEVLVKMKYAAINPSDILTIKGTYMPRINLPRSPGYEGVGIVKALGSNVIFPKVGMRVLPLRGTGTWQEYVTTRAEETVVVPDDIDDITAAQLYINPMTIWLMLKELKLRKNDTIVVNAAGSLTGYIAACFCKILGFRMIAVVRNDRHTEKLLKAGACHVINTQHAPLQAAIDQITSGKGVDAALECVGGEDAVNLARCVMPGSVMLHYGLLSGIPLPQTLYIEGNNVTVRPYFLRNWVYEQPVTERMQEFQRMIDIFVENKISLSAGHLFNLEEFREALKKVESSDRLGKVLFKMT